jgi:hypothetical protein
MRHYSFCLSHLPKFLSAPQMTVYLHAPEADLPANLQNVEVGALALPLALLYVRRMETDTFYIIVALCVFPALWLLAAYLDRVWPRQPDQPNRHTPIPKD